MSTWDIALEGLLELLATYKGVEKGMLDFRDLGTWDEVQRRAYRAIDAQFAAEGKGKSGKWTQLTSPYKEIKAARYGPVPILTATGKMRRSLTTSGGDAVVEKRPLELVLGSRDPKAAFHQSGTRRMKARPIIDFTPEQEREIVVEPVQRHLKQIVANAKLRSLR